MWKKINRLLPGACAAKQAHPSHLKTIENFSQGVSCVQPVSKGEECASVNFRDQ